MDKNIAKKYKSRRNNAREQIMNKRVAKGQPRTGQIITNEMIQDQMNMEATRLIRENRSKTWKILILTRWCHIAVLPWRKKRRIANNHYKDVMLWKSVTPHASKSSKTFKKHRINH